MKCPYCHEPIDDDARRCKHCAGELLPCPNCGGNVGVETKSKFVGLARGGTKDVKKCMNCGKVLYGPQCFVATAVYTAPDCREIVVLRRFRDRVLMQSHFGRLLVRLYYRVGPSLARFVVEFAWLRLGAKWLLDLAVHHIDRAEARRV